MQDLKRELRDLPESVQQVAAQLLAEKMSRGGSLLNPSGPGNEYAKEIRDAFIQLYSANDVVVTNKLVIEIEPRIVGLEKIEALVELLSGRHPGFAEGYGPLNGFRAS